MENKTKKRWKDSKTLEDEMECRSKDVKEESIGHNQIRGVYEELETSGTEK